LCGSVLQSGLRVKALATAEPLSVESLQSAGDTEWLTAHKETDNMKKYTVKIQVEFLDV